MAAASGQSQGTKKEFTAEQKRTFALLGVMGVLALGAGAIYLPGLLSGGSSGDSATTPATTEPVATDVAQSAVSPETGAPGADPSAAGAAPAAAPAAGAAKSALGYTPPVARSRRDPFQQFIQYTEVPTPVPPPPVPTPVPPIEIPRPLPAVFVPRPGDGSVPPFSVTGAQGPGGVSLPGAGGGATNSSNALILPQVSIPRMNSIRGTPDSAFPPRRATSGGGGSDPQPAYDKRLSGVIIANGIRALLEITRGTEIVTHVVQPGDTVEGIQILNIERFTEGTRTITRMTVRENGQERYVELRAAPQRAAGAGGPEGAGNPFGQ